jgi:hypothetical protein
MIARPINWTAGDVCVCVWGGGGGGGYVVWTDPEFHTSGCRNTFFASPVLAKLVH